MAQQILLNVGEWLLTYRYKTTKETPPYYFLENTRTGACDYPLLHFEDNVVVFDYPERIPEFPRKTIASVVQLHDRLLESEVQNGTNE